MIDRDRAVVRKQPAPLDVGWSGVVWRQARAPGDVGAEGPRQRFARRDIVNEIVRRQAVGVVEGIQVVAELQLFKIIQTGDAQGLLLGFAQRRQQQRRENRNHGYHHQQFNQSEAAIVSAEGNRLG